MAKTIVSTADFIFLANKLREQCGFVLEPGKEYLITARLTPLVQKLGMATIDQLIERLRGGSHHALLTEVVEAMVITETSFFRDERPFETLKTAVFPELIERRRSQRQLNIWCAACASGQEPYSIAMLIREHFPELIDWRINLSATDLSQEMLQRSRTARYSQFEVNRGLPPSLLLKWFHQDGAYWRLDDRIRSMITFTQLNLVRAWPAMPKWDLVCLRNVMIYFDNVAKSDILGRVAGVLCNDGYLVLGGAETTLNLDNSYFRNETLNSGFYQLKPLEGT